MEIKLKENYDDYLEAKSHGTRVYIECVNPWAETEIRRGCSGSVLLTKEQARQLAEFLTTFAESDEDASN